jgi:hypothetical protein
LEGHGIESHRQTGKEDSFGHEYKRLIMYDIKFDDIWVRWLAIDGIEDLTGGGL